MGKEVEELQIEIEGQGNPDELKIEVVDDTPEKDRNRKPVSKEEFPTDADLDKYSGDVERRLKELSHGYHDERRAKEAATRERDEAVAFAKRQLELNQQLKQQLENGSKQLIDTSASAAEAAMDAAKRKFTEAYNSGDADKIAEAQAAISAAQIKKVQSEAMKPLQFPEPEVYNAPQQVQVPRPDDKALDWQAENEWFGKQKSMTAFALGLHEELVEEGVNPQSDDYYEKIDSRMRKTFPEYFRSQTSPGSEEPTQRTRAQGNVVAPASRSTAPKRITLTASQVALAKRLGLTNEQYAHELMKLGGK